jgi:beta-lactamase class A
LPHRANAVAARHGALECSTRRMFVSASAAVVLHRPASAQDRRQAFAHLQEEFTRIEQDSGGRLGIAVRDTRSGAAATHRADERFPMCSTFKFLAAAAILSRVDAGPEKLDRTYYLRPSRHCTELADDFRAPFRRPHEPLLICTKPR